MNTTLSDGKDNNMRYAHTINNITTGRWKTEQYTWYDVTTAVYTVRRVGSEMKPGG